MDLSRASWSSHAWVLGLAVASAVACSSTTDTNADPAKSGPTDGERIESGSTTSGQFNASDAAAPAAGGCVPNSAYFDVPGNGCDDDGDGIVDNTSCDDALAADGSAEDFAKAVGLCHKAGDNGHGVISAKFTRGYGRTDEPKPDQHGVLAKFGDVLTPREGARFGVLSTGYAKEFNGSANTPFGGEVAQAPYIYGKDWWNYGVYKAGKAGTGTLPPGYPKPASGCTQVATVNDVIEVKLELRAPLNAIGIKFDFNFLSGEWPAFVCSSFNDGFAAFVTAPSINGGQITNISFDKNENPVSVNNAFFDRCTPD
ncbi:MAG TPA: choice-of-anchor L domain-containing protein, partial [Labilithrix sp.]|nr:choice-of-anchor L domain-containing protein [Labilithrix sp.]